MLDFDVFMKVVGMILKWEGKLHLFLVIENLVNSDYHQITWLCLDDLDASE